MQAFIKMAKEDMVNLKVELKSELDEYLAMLREENLQPVKNFETTMLSTVGDFTKKIT